VPVRPEDLIVPVLDAQHHLIDPDGAAEVGVLPEVKARDARRDRRLRQLGWTVDRFDEDEVIFHPDQVLTVIRRRLVELGVDVTRVPPPLPDLRDRPIDRRPVP